MFRMPFVRPSKSADPLAEHIELLRKSPWLDPVWYRETYADLLDTPIDVARHYLLYGVSEGRNPGPNFDTKFYLNEYPDVANARINPLLHYILYGEKEGRVPHSISAKPRPVTAAQIRSFKTPVPHKELALFVTHAPHGVLRPHVRHNIESLVRQGISPVLIVATDGSSLSTDDPLLSISNGVFVRSNEGYDFAAWAHVLRIHPELYNVNILYLLNDSIIGPLNETLFADVLKRIRASEADFVGLTDNYEICWHVQSFFLAFKERALSSVALRAFFNEVVSHSEKASVITEYETRLAPALSKAGFRCEVLFPARTQLPINRTIVEWKALIQAGFPFIKVTTIRDNFPDVDVSDWREVLASHGFDVSLAERALTKDQSLADREPSSTSVAKSLSPPNGFTDRKSEELHRQTATEKRPLFSWVRLQKRSALAQVIDSDSQGEVSPEFYLAAYPDVAAAGMDPYIHYTRYGRPEGRLGSVPGIEALRYFHSRGTVRETVLVVTHEGVRSGCPVLSYNLIRNLLSNYDVVALFLGPGPILDACREAGAVVVGPISLSGSPRVAEIVVEKIVAATPIKFALVNSIESRHVLPALTKKYIPNVILIHEFAAYIRPRGAFRDAALWAGRTVFSTPITRDSAINEHPDLGIVRNYPIIPQGHCVVPTGIGSENSSSHDDGEIERVRRTLRPNNFPADGIVVLGIGQVEFRKGVDIFIECAARVTKLAPDLFCRFVWIGRGFNPDSDVAYSAYLSDQIRRSNLNDRVVFLGETTEVSTAYGTADMLVLSSRLDPLPNVAIEAFEAGLPVICFAKTTGIADILMQHGLGAHTVASYLDVDEMAQKVISLARAKELRAQMSRQLCRLAASTFDMTAYVTQLQQLAVVQEKSFEQERLDASLIYDSGIARLDYYLLPAQRTQSPEDVIRAYVRSWASGIGRRKLFPGFHPGIYLERHGVENEDADPLADYLRADRPKGPWTFELITPADRPAPIPSSVRAALHIHAYYPEIAVDILRRLACNNVRPDLLISVTSEAARMHIQRQLHTYKGNRVVIRVVPNKGRDIGPFLTEFGSLILTEYDLIGHLHTKKSADLVNKTVGENWYQFLLENLLGGDAPMADIILTRMVADPNIGIVFPDDPHVIGWDGNKDFVAPYLRTLSVSSLPEHFTFPVGTMFWARPEAIRALFELKLTWEDYPDEPLPYDGSLLHALERLFGLVASQSKFIIANTYCPGVTR